MTLRVRRARTIRDRAWCEAIDRSLPDPFPEPLEVSRHALAWLLIAPDVRVPVGYLVASEYEGGAIELDRYAILSAGRGQGGGEKLLRALNVHAIRSGATRGATYTATWNVASQRALARAGWVPYGLEVDEDGAEWLLWEVEWTRARP